MNSALSASDEKNWAPTMAKKAGFMEARRLSDCPYITAFAGPDFAWIMRVAYRCCKDTALQQIIL
jgi:hypothetical protein